MFPYISTSKNPSIDPEGRGDCTSLEEAIERSNPVIICLKKFKQGTIIKLAEGVYTCNTEIKKDGLKIERKDKDKPVYLLGNEGPVLNIKLEESQHIVLKDIQIAHTGINIQTKFIQSLVN